jgi:hypothetical protein
VLDRDKEKLDRKFDRFSEMLPRWLQRALDWLRQPSSAMVRIPLGILFILLGFLGFLPILGFWMVPVGVLLLAQDIPFLQRPTRWALTKLERRWTEWRRKRQATNRG